MDFGTELEALSLFSLANTRSQKTLGQNSSPKTVPLSEIDTAVTHSQSCAQPKKWPLYICNGMLSSTGRVAISLTAAYSVTKYGVEGFSDVLRREMHPWGIKVSMVEPGAHQTPMTDPRTFERQFRQAWNELSAELQKDYGPEYLEKGIPVFIYLLFTLSIAGLAVSTRKFDREIATLERKAVPPCCSNCKTTATKRNRVDKCDVTLPR